VKSSGGRDFLILLALCVLGGVLGRLQSNSRQNGISDFVSAAVRSVTRPLATGFTSAANGAGDFFEGIFNAAELSRKSRELKQYQLIASQYSETLARLSREIDNIRALQSLPPIGGRSKVYATVIAFAPNENRITISAGKAQGLRPGLAVLTAEGLVGTIQTVDHQESQVILISDPNRKIGAIVISRDPPPIGLIKGENEALLVLTLDSTAPVENGDLVSTSGFSDRIPRGIPIGRVNQVYADPTTGSKRVEVFPSVGLGNLREVVVLK